MVNRNSSVFVRQSSVHNRIHEFPIGIIERHRKRVCFALFDLLVLPLVAVSRQVAVTLPPASLGTFHDTESPTRRTRAAERPGKGP